MDPQTYQLIRQLQDELAELRQAIQHVPARWASGGGGGGRTNIVTGTAQEAILFGAFGDVLTDHATPQTIETYSAEFEVPKDARVTIAKNVARVNRWEVIAAPTWYPLFGPEEIAKGTKTTIRILGSDHRVKALFGKLQQNKWWGLQWTTDQEGRSAAGPKYAGTVSNDNTIGGSDWVSPANAIGTINGTEASSTHAASKYLKATGYGFSLAATTTITGIEVTIRYRNLGPQPYKDLSVRIVKANAVVGSEKAIATAWPTLAGLRTYGDSADLWGTTWTAAEINAADFGFAIAGQRDGIDALPDARIDAIGIKVFYKGASPAEDSEPALWIGTELEC